MRLQKLLAVLAILPATGCFEYRATPIAPVPTGQEIRLALTDVGRVAIAPLAGEGIDRIDGIVDVSAPDSIAVRVKSVRRRDVPETWTRERLAVASRDVASVSVKHFSPLRTALVVGGLALAGSTIRLGTSDSFFGGRRGPGGTTGGR